MRARNLPALMCLVETSSPAPWHRFDEDLVLLRVRLVAEAQGRRQHFARALADVLDYPSNRSQDYPSCCGRFERPAGAAFGYILPKVGRT